MEEVCDVKSGYHVAVFRDNQPKVLWVDQLESKISVVAGQLLRPLALRLEMKGASTLTPFHIAGNHNSITNIPLRSFGSEPKWHCKTYADLLILLNNKFLLPKKASCTVLNPTKDISMKLLSVLWMGVTIMEEWNIPGKIGKHTGKIGAPSSHLWKCTLSYRIPQFETRSAACQDLEACCERYILVVANKSKLAQSLELSLSLARQSLCPTKYT